MQNTDNNPMPTPPCNVKRDPLYVNLTCLRGQALPLATLPHVSLMAFLSAECLWWAWTIITANSEWASLHT